MTSKTKPFTIKRPMFTVYMIYGMAGAILRIIRTTIDAAMAL